MCRYCTVDISSPRMSAAVAQDTGLTLSLQVYTAANVLLGSPGSRTLPRGWCPMTPSLCSATKWARQMTRLTVRSESLDPPTYLLPLPSPLTTPPSPPLSVFPGSRASQGCEHDSIRTCWDVLPTGMKPQTRFCSPEPDPNSYLCRGEAEWGR